MKPPEGLIYVEGTINSVYRDLMKYKTEIKSILTEKDHKLAIFEIGEMNNKIDDMLDSLSYCDTTIKKVRYDIEKLENKQNG